MKSKISNNLILAVAPTRWGLGVAVIEGKDALVDWGMRATQGDKNAAGVAEVKKLIAQYRPDTVVLEDACEPGSRRSVRIRSLFKRVLSEAKKAGLNAVALRREEIRRAFFADGLGTKDAIAAAVADTFSAELGNLLPSKRTIWVGEHFRMGVFEALAVGLVFAKKVGKK